MNENFVLHADSIGKSFKNKRVLSSASMRVSGGGIVGLLGRMGEGKSTLLKICAGIDSPDGGWVKYRGKIRSSAFRSLRPAEGIYYLPESGGLAESLTLTQHFELFRRRFHLGIADECIERFDVGALMNSSPAAMSTGERRRAEVALLSYSQPSCLLADEIFRGLDPLTAETIGCGLQLLASTGCAIIVTGHEVRSLRPYLTSVVWLTSGTTYEMGNPDNAWENERFRREYLGFLI